MITVQPSKNIKDGIAKLIAASIEDYDRDTNNEKMKEEFYDWLDDCPVQWRRGEVNQDSISYTFICDDEEVKDES